MGPEALGNILGGSLANKSAWNGLVGSCAAKEPSSLSVSHISVALLQVSL